MADEDEAQDFFFARGDEASNLAANEDPMDYRESRELTALAGLAPKLGSLPILGYPQTKAARDMCPHMSLLQQVLPQL